MVRDLKEVMKIGAEEGRSAAISLTSDAKMAGMAGEEVAHTVEAHGEHACSSAYEAAAEALPLMAHRAAEGLVDNVLRPMQKQFVNLQQTTADVASLAITGDPRGFNPSTHDSMHTEVQSSLRKPSFNTTSYHAQGQQLLTTGQQLGYG